MSDYQPILWPSWRFHKTEGARIFESQEELDAAGDGWRDRPFRDDEDSEDDTQEAAPRRGRPRKEQ